MFTECSQGLCVVGFPYKESDDFHSLVQRADVATIKQVMAVTTLSPSSDWLTPLSPRSLPFSDWLTPLSPLL